MKREDLQPRYVQYKNAQSDALAGMFGDSSQYITISGMIKAARKRLDEGLFRPNEVMANVEHVLASREEFAKFYVKYGEGATFIKHLFALKQWRELKTFLESFSKVPTTDNRSGTFPKNNPKPLGSSARGDQGHVNAHSVSTAGKHNSTDTKVSLEGEEETKAYLFLSELSELIDPTATWTKDVAEGRLDIITYSHGRTNECCVDNSLTLYSE